MASYPEELFGQPIRVPNILDESQLYDPRSIQFNPRPSTQRVLVETNPPPRSARVMQVVQEYPQQDIAVQREMRDSYIGGANTPLPQAQKVVHMVPRLIQESEILLPVAPAAAQAPKLDIYIAEINSLKKANATLIQEMETIKNSLGPAPGSPPYALLSTEVAKLKLRNQALITENGRNNLTRISAQTKGRAYS